MDSASLHPESAVPMVTVNFPRSVHRALLLACGIEGTREFWLRNPLRIDGKALGPAQFAAYLERDDAMCPMAFVGRVMSELEPFLIARNIDVEQFCESLLVHANGGSHVSARVILSLAAPYLSRLFRVRDPHQLFLRMCVLACRTFVPDLIIAQVGRTELSGEGCAAYLAVGFEALTRGELEAWDASIFTARLLRLMPLSLGLEPFQETQVVCDARHVEQVTSASSAVVTVDHELVYIDGLRIGRYALFEAYCSSRGIQLKGINIPSSRVVLIERDWFCPVRKRVVLREGSALGAPLYILKLCWTLQRAQLRDTFLHVIREAVQGPPSLPDDGRARALIRAYKGASRPVMHCTYDSRSQTLYLDDMPLVRGVPALILRRCLREYSASGREKFTFREFKDDREIISQPKNTGFEVRLRRLRERLAAESNTLWIEPIGRGAFAMRCFGELVFEEAS